MTTSPLEVAQAAAPLRFGKRSAALALAGAGVALGIVYALAVPRGLPYDEPAHWNVVEHVANTGTLPVLGDPGVSYEAQQGPLAYVVYAAVVRATQAVDVPLPGQFFAARIAGLAWLAMCVLLAVRLLRRAMPQLPAAPVLCGVAVAYLNPMVVADAASVQNDLPSMALALLAIDLCTREQDAGTAPSSTADLIAGATCGLALLAKLSVWPVAVVLFVWMWRRGSFVRAVRFTAAATVVLGWWLLRNIHLYGDPSAAAGVKRAGVDFPPLGWHGITTLEHLVRPLVTFLWIPVEYYRNTIHAPTAVELLVLAASAACVAGSWLAFRRPGPVAAMLAVAAAFEVVSWALIDVFVEGASPRIAYGALPVWAICATTVIRRIQYRTVGVATVGAGLTVLHIWTISAMI